MGIENNNCVVATTWDKEEVKRIKKWVNSLTEMKSLFLFSQEEINLKTTVIMVPDGSKEGWDESNKGDALRDQFIEELERGDYEDGTSPWKFVEVGYGEFGQKVLRGNCHNCYDDSEYYGGDKK